MKRVEERERKREKGRERKEEIERKREKGRVGKNEAEWGKWGVEHKLYI